MVCDGYDQAVTGMAEDVSLFVMYGCRIDGSRMYGAV